MIGTTLGFDGQGSLVLFVVGDRAPDRDEWKTYVDYLKDRVAIHGKVRLVVVAGSAGPDALQRKQLGESVPSKKLRTAVVSDSMVARGVITAFRWYGLEIDAFKSSEVDAACRYLAASDDETAWLNRTLASIRSSLQGARTAAR